MTTPTTQRVALIASRWHSEIVDRAVASFETQLTASGYDIEVHQVPGAFEIPLMAKRLASSGRYAAVAACGLVVDGGIYRHDFVAAAVIDGLMRVQLDVDVPVFSAVLTPHHFHEHDEHRGYFSTHFETKGAELATAVAITLDAYRALES